MILTDEQLHEVIKRLTQEMLKGLNKDTHKDAVVRCYPTYVQSLPTGTGK